MISPQTIQQITNRIDIIDAVGGFVKLKKRGINYIGLCPFHDEKTPSFTVSPSKEIYKCFGCGRSGNTITFLMEHEKYSYVEALRWLANRYNIDIQETEVSDEIRQQQQNADSLYILNSFAQKFFASQLFESEDGKHNALSFLEERGFNDDIIRKFQLGYNPQARNEFANTAIQNKFAEEVLLKSGLVVAWNEQLIDNYRGRIIFPVHNNTGKIIGFGARVIGKADRVPKYINTPENEIYIKSKILYGLFFARQAIDKNDECLLVEGYTDVVALHQSGIENVVASGGTSLTTDQLRLIKKYTNNLTIVYDGDAAGVKAALRGLDMALEESLNVKLVLVPDNEDPDSYLRKIGATGFKDFIADNKKDFIFFQLDVMLKEAGNDLNKKNEAVNQVAKTISKVNKAEDFTKRQEYIRQCASILKIDEAGFTHLVNKFIREKITKEEKNTIYGGKPLFNQTSFESVAAQKSEHPSSPEMWAGDEAINLLLEDEYQEREVVKRLVEYGNQLLSEGKHACPPGRRVADVILEAFQEYHLKNPKLEKIVERYYQMLDTSGYVDSKNFLYSDDNEMNAFVAGLLHFPYELHDWGRRLEGYTVKMDNDINTVIGSALSMYKLRKIKRMYLELENDLQSEKEEKKYIAIMKIYEQLKQIERSITKDMQTAYLK